MLKHILAITALTLIGSQAQALLKAGTVGISTVFNDYNGKVSVVNQEDWARVEFDKTGEQATAGIFIPWCNPANPQQKLIITVGDKHIDLCDSHWGTLVVSGDVAILKSTQVRIHDILRSGRDTGRRTILTDAGPNVIKENDVATGKVSLALYRDKLYYLYITNDGSVFFEAAAGRNQ